MVSTVYKGDLSEVTFGKECGLVLAHGGFGGLQFAVDGSDRNKINFSGASEGFFPRLLLRSDHGLGLHASICDENHQAVLGPRYASRWTRHLADKPG